ncbi:hypothetical protein [Moorena producens]|uniref:hypothetical protein n=1 Tax=Moorena producens TaxID=1155739 RepID=UPI003C76A78D
MPQLLNLRTILTADYFYIKGFLRLEANLWCFTLEIFGKHMRYLRCGQRSAVSGQPSAVSRQPWAFGPRCLRCFVAQALTLGLHSALCQCLPVLLDFVAVVGNREQRITGTVDKN